MSAIVSLAYDEREEKLPAWARRKLDLARQYTLDAKELAERARLDTKPDETNVVIDPYENTIGLPKDARVRFLLPSVRQGWRDNWIDVRHERSGVLELMSSSTLAVLPRASNVVHAGVVE